MNRDSLQGLRQLAELKFERALAPVRDILAEEARLAGDLARLDRLAQGDGGAEMRLIGADLAWIAWTEAARRDLRLRQARLRAQKAAVIDRLRTEFGRCEAARLLEAAAAERRGERRRKAFESRMTGL